MLQGLMFTSEEPFRQQSQSRAGLLAVFRPTRSLASLPNILISVRLTNRNAQPFHRTYRRPHKRIRASFSSVLRHYCDFGVTDTFRRLTVGLRCWFPTG
jgi:hypothetical protein